MTLFLHSPNNKDGDALKEKYQLAFNNAQELFIVSAFLKVWESFSDLNAECDHFRMIVSSDFGLTKKSACRDVMKWLPKGKKSDFFMADNIQGFHPKAVFWKEKGGKCFAIVGSSNLTTAAFESNYEANVFLEITGEEFKGCREWIREIQEKSSIVTNELLENYGEKSDVPKGNGSGKEKKSSWLRPPFKLPTDPSLEKLKARRKQLKEHEKHSIGLVGLFRSCADGEKSSEEFYEELPKFGATGTVETGFKEVDGNKEGKLLTLRVCPKVLSQYLMQNPQDGMI